MYRAVVFDLDGTLVQTEKLKAYSYAKAIDELAAGMEVLAVTTPFTRQAFGERDLLDRRWVVDDPAELPNVLWERLLAHQRETHGG